MNLSRGRRHNSQWWQYAPVQIFVVMTIVAATMLAAGFYLGQSAAYSGMGLDPEVYHRMHEELPALRDQQTLLEGQLQIQTTRHEVDRAALELVRRQMANQDEQIAELQESLRFYRGLMSPDAVHQGLALRVPELVAQGSQPGRIGYRFVVQQVARRHELARGILQVEIYGSREGEQVAIALSDVAENVEAAGIPLRFRYFQSVEGEMLLPENFEPRGINMTASFSKPKKTQVSQQFEWQLQQGFTDVGK